MLKLLCVKESKKLNKLSTERNKINYSIKKRRERLDLLQKNMEVKKKWVSQINSIANERSHHNSNKKIQ